MLKNTAGEIKISKIGPTKINMGKYTGLVFTRLKGLVTGVKVFVDLLGVPELTTVITKIDMVDAARLETVRSQVAELVGATRFGNVLSHLVSAKSGTGIQGLRNELFARAEQLQKHGSYFRLPIDRVW